MARQARPILGVAAVMAVVQSGLVLGAIDSKTIRMARSGSQPDWVQSVAFNTAMLVTGGGDSIIRGFWLHNGRASFTWEVSAHKIHFCNPAMSCVDQDSPRNPSQPSPLWTRRRSCRSS